MSGSRSSRARVRRRSNRPSRCPTSTCPYRARCTRSTPPLVDTPELVNSDPYGEGWILEVALADVSELDALLDAAQYRAVIEAA